MVCKITAILLNSKTLIFFFLKNETKTSPRTNFLFFRYLYSQTLSMLVFLWIHLLKNIKFMRGICDFIANTPSPLSHDGLYYI